MSTKHKSTTQLKFSHALFLKNEALLLGCLHLILAFQSLHTTNMFQEVLGQVGRHVCTVTSAFSGEKVTESWSSHTFNAYWWKGRYGRAIASAFDMVRQQRLHSLSHTHKCHHLWHMHRSHFTCTQWVWNHVVCQSITRSTASGIEHYFQTGHARKRCRSASSPTLVRQLPDRLLQPCMVTAHKWGQCLIHQGPRTEAVTT